MATTPEGIMALNQPQGAAPQLSYEDSYDAMRQALQQARPDADMEMQEMLDEIRGQLKDLTDAQLQQMITAVQQLYDDPEGYAQTIAQAIQDGDIDPEAFPPEYDEEYLASVLVVLRDEQRSRLMASSSTAPMEMMMPQQFARGGIAEAARIVASQGRYGDTMLAHITPEEASFLRARGGSGTINPVTGLPEFFLKGLLKGIGKIFTDIGKGIKKVLQSPLGRIVATIGLGVVMGPAVASFLPGLSTAAAAGVTGALASGTVTALSGGSLKDVLMSSAVGFLGAPGGPASNFIGKYTGQFINNPTVNAAVTGAVVGTGAGLLQGQDLKGAVQSGLVSGAIAGGTSFVQSRGNIAQAKAAAEQGGAQGTTDFIEEVALSKTGAVSPSPELKLEPLSLADEITPSSAASAAADAQKRAALTGTTQPVSLDQQKADIISRSMVRTPSTDALKQSVGATTPGPVAYSPTTTYPGAPLKQIADFSSPQTGGDYYTDPITLELKQAPAVASAVPPAGTTTTAGAAAPYPTGGPGIMDAFGKIKQGDVLEGLGDIFMPSGPTSEQVLASAEYKNLIANNISPTEAFKIASNKMSPGMLRTYGPAAAAGVGALAAFGGFDQQPLPESELGKQLRQPIDLSDNPSAYYIQGLPGVKYGPRGEILGSESWSPQQTMADIRVPTQSYTGYTPRYMNMGGIAALRSGGYPRRTGQISGPGTETSDSIPAMLSDGEFVMTARAVRGMGNGSRREGAKKMYALMHKLERNAARG